MTLILGLDCADGLLLASDGQETVSTGGQPVKREGEKLRRPWTNIAWGGSGPVPVIQLVERALAKDHSHQNKFETKAVSDTRDKLAETVTKAVRKAITEDYMEVPGEPPPYADFLFVGHAEDGPFMLEIHKTLLHTDQIAAGFTAIGSGDIFPYYAMAALGHYRVNQRPLREVKLIACRILEDAINTAAFGLGPPIQMVEIEKRAGQCGVARKLSREDVQVLQDQVIEWKGVEGEALTKLVGIRQIEDSAAVMLEEDEGPAAP